jgi:hypothetical protein
MQTIRSFTPFRSSRATERSKTTAPKPETYPQEDGEWEQTSRLGSPMRAAYAGELPKPHSIVPLAENHRAWMVRACASAVLVGLDNEGLDDNLEAVTRYIESYEMETLSCFTSGELWMGSFVAVWSPAHEIW